MPRAADQTLPLQDWCVLSLRARGRHAGLRAASARLGARTLALSPLIIEMHDDDATRDALRQALRADIVLFTSPNAAAAAAALRAPALRRGQIAWAVGSGTRRALRAHGIDARAPTRMDSEGLLALPQLADIAGRRVGLITGAGGRNLLAPALRKRGAEVFRADVYARRPVPLPPTALGKLGDALADPQRVLLPLSSGEALHHVLAELPGALRRPFARIAVAAASERLAQAAREAGFRRIAVACDARPASLLRAASDAFG